MGREDDDNEEPNDAEVVNISSEIMRFELDGIRYKLGPKETTRINKVHTISKKTAPGRDPVAPTIELITNKKVVPTTDKRARAVMGPAQPR